MLSLNSIKLNSESAHRESAGLVARIIEEGHKTGLTDTEPRGEPAVWPF